MKLAPIQNKNRNLEDGMKRSLAGAVLALGATVSAYGQSPADKEKTIKYLDHTRRGVVNTTAGLSAAQWTFKPGPDR
jgi:hypothetical protein